MVATLLANLLKAEEGFVPHAYPDTKGFWTIGYGRMIDKKLGGGITREEAEMLLANDIFRLSRELDARLPWWRTMDENRQLVIACMAFQMGMTKLMKFKRTLAAMEAGLYEDAATFMLESKWARVDTPSRARRLAQIMRTGDYLDVPPGFLDDYLKRL